MYKNNGSAASASFGAMQANPFGLTGQYTMFKAVADIDGDGDMDILASAQDYSTYTNQFLYFENTGTAQNPSFGTPQINPWGLASPATAYILVSELVDLDNDGDFDLLAKDAYYGNFFYYRNNGSDSNPSFGVVQANPFGLTSPGLGVGYSR